MIPRLIQLRLPELLSVPSGLSSINSRKQLKATITILYSDISSRSMEENAIYISVPKMIETAWTVTYRMFPPYFGACVALEMTTKPNPATIQHNTSRIMSPFLLKFLSSSINRCTKSASFHVKELESSNWENIEILTCLKKWVDKMLFYWKRVRRPYSLNMYMPCNRWILYCFRSRNSTDNRIHQILYGQFSLQMQTRYYNSSDKPTPRILQFRVHE